MVAGAFSNFSGDMGLGDANGKAVMETNLWMGLDSQLRNLEERGHRTFAVRGRVADNGFVRGKGNRSRSNSAKLSRSGVGPGVSRGGNRAVGRRVHLSGLALFSSAKSDRPVVRCDCRSGNVRRSAHVAIPAEHRRDFVDLRPQPRFDIGSRAHRSHGRRSVPRCPPWRSSSRLT